MRYALRSILTILLLAFAMTPFSFWARHRSATKATFMC